jgi:hypothetical protein
VSVVIFGEGVVIFREGTRHMYIIAVGERLLVRDPLILLFATNTKCDAAFCNIKYSLLITAVLYMYFV